MNISVVRWVAERDGEGSNIVICIHLRTLRELSSNERVQSENLAASGKWQQLQMNWGKTKNVVAAAARNANYSIAGN